MASYERLTRREALTVLGRASLTPLALYAGIRAPHYFSYFDYLLKGHVKDDESDLTPYIFDTYGRNPFVVNLEGKNYQISVAKSAFLDGLNVVRSQEKTDKSLEAFLLFNPLRVDLQDNLEPYLAEDDMFYEPVGEYRSLFFGGPKLSFPGRFIREYLQAKLENDINTLADKDTVIYHELIHFFQDFRNPYKHFYLTAYCRDLESPRGISTLLRGCPEDDNLEDEAVAKSRQIVQILRAGYISGKISNWPFGHFFTEKV